MFVDKGVDQAEDLGVDVIRHVYRVMQIDEKWSVKQPRGFTWWGHSLAQRVWSEPVQSSRGHEVWLLRAEADLFCNVPDDEETLDLLSRANEQTALDAVVYDPATQRVSLCCSFFTHSGILPWSRGIFALAVALQTEKANSLLKRGIADVFRGQPNTSCHPENGERIEPDDMLTVAERVVQPRGQEESPFDLEDFSCVAEHATLAGLVASADDSGVSLEIPLALDGRTADECLADLLKTGEKADLELGTALITARREPRHVRLGSGCQLRLHMPNALDPLEATTLAADLNRREATQWAGGHLLGGWCVTHTSAGVDIPVLCFATFLPAVAHSRTVLQNMVMSLSRRVDWIVEQGVLEQK